MHSSEFIELHNDLQLIRKAIQEARDPVDFAIQLSTTMPWVVDYRNRKHLYIFSPIALTISLEDYGTLTLQANVWHNFDFPASMRIFATNQTSPVYAYIKATDETLTLDYLPAVTATISGTPNVLVTNTTSSPVINRSDIAAYTLNGQSFSGTTGINTTGSAITVGASLFNPGGKTIIITAIEVSTGGSAQNQMNVTTSDPAMGTSGTITNNNLGSATSSVASLTYTNAAATVTGTLYKGLGTGGNTMGVLPDNGNVIILPANHGIAVYPVTSTNKWFANFTWIEF
jgi:hypothetical protein